ncbi:DUF1801 domain-containing protein [Paracrocinitomix mangrovi]|uniref:DUF1801 domain-containing protein n=1 Tax=Paracrocinitomix mangrovi TaxID=2862509 RepID=UPI001C8E4AF2|nr:DUF1801 domain-containing protein [Paracrocinitomix mangrovi]UKN02682.1 DUF1801 domain-containing protein [Paracrocinitomix mangrovi]
MRIEAVNMDDYISQLPEERQEPMKKLVAAIEANLPEGFEAAMSYGMPGWVIPHSLYPAGYHCKPEEPLPFLSIASQKNFIAVYHMGVYASPELMKWFTSEYPKYNSKKLDMGKSCIRFKKVEEIPFELIGELASKMTAQEWIDLYEANYKR